MKTRTTKAFYIFTISISISLLVPYLVQDGMFLDGIVYSTISRNLSEGIGSLGEPLMNAFYPPFHEHPPLVFAIQSVFFKFLGGSIYTERFYSLLTAVLTAWGMVACWKLFFQEKEDYKRFSWLPVLIWITVSVIFWSYRNNLLENTLSVFTLFSVWFIGKGLMESKKYMLVIASLFILAAFLSKGPVGIFPMITATVYGLILRNKKDPFPWKESLLNFLWPIVISLSLFILLPGLKENISAYFDQQLLPALRNEREITTNNRFYILLHFISQMLLPLGVIAFLLVYKKIKKKDFKETGKVALFFAFIGLSASFPLILTLKQRGFYLVPSIPFFAMAIAGILVPYMQRLLSGLSEKIIYIVRIVSVALFVFTLVFSTLTFGNYSRDKELLHDVYAISTIVKEGTTIRAGKEPCNNWSLHAYLNRIHHTGLDCSNGSREYFLINKEDFEEFDYKKYQRIEAGLRKYILLKQK